MAIAYARKMWLSLNQQTHVPADGLTCRLKLKQVNVHLFIFSQQYVTYAYITFYDSPILVPGFSLIYPLLVSIALRLLLLKPKTRQSG